MAQQRIAITAGASGIGLALAQAFAAQGAIVHVCDVQAEALEAVGAANPAIHTSHADVSSDADMARFFATIGDTLDVLINNAGISGPTGRCEDIAPDDWTRTIDVNLNGAFRATRLAIPRLRRGHAASIVMMSSNAGLFGCPLRSPYVASKWALIGLTKTLAMELGPEGITVNAVCPASVEGPRIRGVIARDAAARGLDTTVVEAEYKRQSSMRQFIQPSEIVDMVSFLISPAARNISGQAIAVDGHTEGLWSDLEPAT
ncbi:SDR family oxidoreductase [Novosphingobium sp.]|uniref:SDR family oxidoreductase n=1 Tax=Novosphingobium sp. TaxID=1874826 RepID=UPI003341D017